MWFSKKSADDYTLEALAKSEAFRLKEYRKVHDDMSGFIPFGVFEPYDMLNPRRLSRNPTDG